MKALCAALGTLLLASNLARAETSSLLRSENDHVHDGNEKLAAGDAKGALAAYDRAARELPSEGGVHLNRGLALLKAGDLAASREALKLATRPPASTAIRADANHDLGIGFYKEADAHAAKNEHEEAQKLFREAKDAFKHSMRLRPGNRDSAWNYELAARRLSEQQEKQKKKEEQEKKKEEKKDPQEQDKKQEGDSGDSEGEKDQEQKPGDKQEQKKKEEQKQAEQKKTEPQPQDQKAQQAPPQKLPPDVAQALDALEDGEQNLERMRAQQRANQERRKPEKDW